MTTGELALLLDRAARLFADIRLEMLHKEQRDTPTYESATAMQVKLELAAEELSAIGKPVQDEVPV